MKKMLNEGSIIIGCKICKLIFLVEPNIQHLNLYDIETGTPKTRI